MKDFFRAFRRFLPKYKWYIIGNIACNAIAPFLSEGETTVGTKLDISHDAATPEGLTVTATAEITGVSGREISYHVTAEDGVGVIGSGTHKRFLVDADRFLNKAQKRGQ